MLRSGGRNMRAKTNRKYICIIKPNGNLFSSSLVFLCARTPVIYNLQILLFSVCFCTRAGARPRHSIIIINRYPAHRSLLNNSERDQSMFPLISVCTSCLRVIFAAEHANRVVFLFCAYVYGPRTCIIRTGRINALSGIMI